MKRLLFYLIKSIAFICKGFSHKLYMKLIVLSYKIIGVHFTGMPAYIDKTAHIDPSGGLKVGKGVGITVNAIVLTHDWSFLRRYRAMGIIPPSEDELKKKAFKSVEIGDYSLVGAGAIVLPGTKIGTCCLIGAGCVIKGVVEDYSIMIGNPAKKIGDTRYSKKEEYIKNENPNSSQQLR